jgi:hypothetical protein
LSKLINKVIGVLRIRTELVFQGEAVFHGSRRTAELPQFLFWDVFCAPSDERFVKLRSGVFSCQVTTLRCAYAGAPVLKGAFDAGLLRQAALSSQ